MVGGWPGAGLATCGLRHCLAVALHTHLLRRLLPCLLLALPCLHAARRRSGGDAPRRSGGSARSRSGWSGEGRCGCLAGLHGAGLLGAADCCVRAGTPWRLPPPALPAHAALPRPSLPFPALPALPAPCPPPARPPSAPSWRSGGAWRGSRSGLRCGWRGGSPWSARPRCAGGQGPPGRAGRRWRGSCSSRSPGPALADTTSCSWTPVLLLICIANASTLALARMRRARCCRARCRRRPACGWPPR